MKTSEQLVHMAEHLFAFGKQSILASRRPSYFWTANEENIPLCVINETSLQVFGSRLTILLLCVHLFLSDKKVKSVEQTESEERRD